MSAYAAFVKNHLYLLTSPCADRFECPKKEEDKSFCSRGCADLMLYRKLLDTYADFSIGGLDCVASVAVDHSSIDYSFGNSHGRTVRHTAPDSYDFN